MKKARLLLILLIIKANFSLKATSENGSEECLLTDLMHFRDLSFEQLSKMELAKYETEGLVFDFCAGISYEKVQSICPKFKVSE